MNGISLNLAAYTVAVYIVAVVIIIAGLSASIIVSLSKDKTFYQRCKEAGGIPMSSSYSDGTCLSVNAVIRLEKQ